MEHIGDIEHNRDISIAKHMRTVHQSTPFTIKFWVLEVIKLNERRGDLDRLLLQKETGWIYRLNTRVPAGLNNTLVCVIHLNQWVATVDHLSIPGTPSLIYFAILPLFPYIYWGL